MEQIIFLVGVAALFAINSLIAWALAWLLTESISLPWKFKPFNCRECLTFWCTFAIGTVLAYAVTPYIATAENYLTVRFCLVGVSFLAGIVSYQQIKLKFKIYE